MNNKCLLLLLRYHMLVYSKSTVHVVNLAKLIAELLRDNDFCAIRRDALST